MHNERLASGGRNSFDEPVEVFVFILIIDADPALHSHRDINRFTQRGDTLCHQLRLSHQARAKAAGLNPVRRTAHIEIDFRVAPVFANPCSLRAFFGLRPANLQRDGVFLSLKAKQSLTVPMNYRARRHHLCVEQSMTRQHPVKRPAMPVAPIHHGSHAKSV